MAYADISTTGYNLMDMSHGEMVLIRDSLIRSGQTGLLDRETSLKIQTLVKDIDRVISAKQKRDHENHTKI